MDSRSRWLPNLAQPPPGFDAKPQCPMTLWLPPPTTSIRPAPLLPLPTSAGNSQPHPPTTHNEAVEELGSSQELRGLVGSKSLVPLFVSFYLGASYLK